MIWNIPNILTIIRLVAAPAIVIMFLYFSRPIADWFALVIFLVAALSDWFDGYLARLWKQESKFGAMLDPIADKVMVIIALLIITGFSGMNPWILLPSSMIMVREVFVSGLREFLGDSSKLLTVTKLAKWKTAVQMTSIAVLFTQGIFQNYFDMQAWAMDKQAIKLAMLTADVNSEKVELGYRVGYTLWLVGVTTIWISCLLTLFTGWDYFKKALPYLRENN